MKTINKAFVIWQDTIETRRKFIIGFIEKNKEKFSFKYHGEIEEALKKGFSLLKPFDDKNRIYESDVLFSIFSSRLPDPKRKDINKILDKYNLDNYDEFELLVKSGAKLPIDSLSFAEIIDNEGPFFISGNRHYMDCKGECCENYNKDLNIGDELIMELEPENPYDENAIKVLKGNEKGNDMIGYIPRYYCNHIINKLKEFDYKLTIVEFNKDKDCSNCIKVYIKFIDKKSKI